MEKQHAAVGLPFAQVQDRAPVGQSVDVHHLLGRYHTDDPGPHDTDTDHPDTDDTDDTGTVDKPFPYGSSFTVSAIGSGGPPPCDDPALAPAIAQAATWSWGATCGFATGALGPRMQTAALHWSVPVDDSDALTVGEAFTATLSGQTPTWQEGGLRLEQGHLLLEEVCNDAPQTEPVIDRSWTATTGTLRLEVTWTDGFYSPIDAPFRATVQLRDVVFTADDGSGDTCGLPDLDVVSAYLGWLPG